MTKTYRLWIIGATGEDEKGMPIFEVQDNVRILQSIYLKDEGAHLIGLEEVKVEGEKTAEEETPEQPPPAPKPKPKGAPHGAKKVAPSQA